MVRIYHNPRCSKSRATLQLLNDRGVHPEVIEYLDQPPDAATLRDLLEKLGWRRVNCYAKESANTTTWAWRTSP